MPIGFACACGKTLRVRDELAGKRVKCPACAAILTVPVPRLELEEPPPEAGRGPAPAPPKIGKRPERVLTSGPKEWEKPMSVPLLILGMYYRPHRILEYIYAYLSRPVMLASIIGFYFASLGVVAILSLKGYFVGGGPAKERSPLAPAASGAPDDHDYRSTDSPLTHEGKFLAYEVRVHPYTPVVGKPVKVWVMIRDTMTQQAYADGFTAVRQWRDEEDESKKGPAAPAAFARVPKEIFFSHEWTPDRAGLYVFTITTSAPIGGKPVTIEAGAFVAEPAAETLSEAPAPVKVIAGAAAVMFAIVYSVVAIFIEAAILNLASRLFGGGGEFLLLAAVLALIEGVVNFARIGLLVVVPLLGWDWLMIAAWVFRFWEYALVLIALCKVYEMPGVYAIITCFIAGAMKTWLVMILVAFAFRTLGMGSLPGA